MIDDGGEAGERGKGEKGFWFGDDFLIIGAGMFWWSRWGLMNDV